MTTDLTAVVQEAQNTDGGWGYSAGRQSRLEATCWATLALGDARGLERLAAWPRRDGLLLERDGGSVNVGFHALAIATQVARAPQRNDALDTLAGGLARVRGRQITGSEINRQDNTLQGWPWVMDTFSWVEPTSWALMALQAWAARGGAVEPGRIEEGVRLLFDRVCRPGGWNYGNSNMLGTELHPHAPTTAIALLALQRHRDAEPVRRSLGWLEANATRERAGLTLALASLALRAYGRDNAAVRAAIVEQLPVTLAVGNICSLAAVHLVLRDDAPHPFLL